ncbi:MAG: Coenzyme F420 hydrogenase/dehydrogenase, beta subunit C-terminal domain [Candidatus Lokiarchaeota archaeon]|nr:Coenzyme F420 hydrogenase/dehydrogenase, beta subunit C-terminal domain [Candidatus Lokiarchaeota archaeon]
MTEATPKKTLLKDVKIFKDLEEEIIKTNKCCACGACVAYCSSQAFDVIKMEGYTPQFISDANVDNCKECGLCYYICPQTEPLMKQLNDQYHIKDEIGYIQDVVAAKTTDEKIKEMGQDGGLVTTLLTYLFDKNKIDAAIVSEYDEKLRPIPKIIYNKEDLLKSSGTRYSISSNILPLTDFYNIAEDVVEKHHQIYDINQIRMAFVGTPCQCRAVRKMQLLNISPAHVIKYVFGLFCMENFDYQKLFELVKKETNEDPTNIAKMNIKRNFFITNKENKVYEVELNKFDDAVRNHCHECDEFTSRFADISFGGSGAVQQNSMTVIRTKVGEELMRKAFIAGYIDKFSPKKSTIDEWKASKINLFKRMTNNKINKSK